MKCTDFNSIKPYVYWIKDKNTGQKYTGVRWNNIIKNGEIINLNTYFISNNKKNKYSYLKHKIFKFIGKL